MTPPDNTAEAVIQAFNSLPDDQKRIFVADFLKAIPPDVGYMVQMMNRMSIPARNDFLDRILDSLLARLPAERIHATMDSVVIPQIEEIIRKSKRGSDPETVKRNVEICDLRKADKKKWSMGRLAKKYDMTRQSIEEILKNDKKWRHLASQLPHE